MEPNILSGQEILLWLGLHNPRARNQQTRMVPHLKESHCLRDSWTKLNVSPANRYISMFLDFIQQDQVLELYWYVHQHPPPEDAGSTSETLDYLAA